MQDRVIGILDWELSTLGNQMSDVAYCCLVLSQFSTLVSVVERAIPSCFVPYVAQAILLTHNIPFNV